MTLFYFQSQESFHYFVYSYRILIFAPAPHYFLTLFSLINILFFFSIDKDYRPLDAKKGT